MKVKQFEPYAQAGIGRERIHRIGPFRWMTGLVDTAIMKMRHIKGGESAAKLDSVYKRYLKLRDMRHAKAALEYSRARELAGDALYAKGDFANAAAEYWYASAPLDLHPSEQSILLERSGDCLYLQHKKNIGAMDGTKLPDHLMISNSRLEDALKARGCLLNKKPSNTKRVFEKAYLPLAQKLTKQTGELLSYLEINRLDEKYIIALSESLAGLYRKILEAAKRADALNDGRLEWLTVSAQDMEKKAWQYSERASKRI